jgi:hypothetical protein
MTDDEIKALAVAHGFKVFGDGTICAADRGVSGDCTASLPALCRAVELLTIERAAGVCERNADSCRGSRYLISGAVVGAECAKEILALAPNQPSQPGGEGF